MVQWAVFVDSGIPTFEGPDQSLLVPKLPNQITCQMRIAKSALAVERRAKSIMVPLLCFKA